MRSTGNRTWSQPKSAFVGFRFPFVWTATAEEILAKVRLVQTKVRKLVQNNSK